MANTFELIASSTVGSGGAASIDFTSIPSTYTDLIIKTSFRATSATTYNDIDVAFNGSTASMTRRAVYADGSSASSFSAANSRFTYTAASSTTASVFSNGELYIPNYAGSNYKSVSSDVVSEMNSASQNLLLLLAGLWSNTAAINQITLTPTSGTFVQYSTAYLYGVKNA